MFFIVAVLTGGTVFSILVTSSGINSAIERTEIPAHHSISGNDFEGREGSLPLIFFLTPEDLIHMKAYYLLFTTHYNRIIQDILPVLHL